VIGPIGPIRLIRLMINLAINGFGRIGRVALRVVRQYYARKVRIKAINTSGSMEAPAWAHLFKYDSVYGLWPEDVSCLPPKLGGEIGRLQVGKDKYPLLAQRDPKRIPWSDYGVDVVLECTGVFRDHRAEGHFQGGAKKVIISAPTKATDIPTYIFGVNDHLYQGEKLISNGSCTTNCVAPIVKAIDEEFGFQEAMMTTIHAYTSTQNLVDGSAKDLRRARAAAQNLVPTGTGAAISVVAAYPAAKGRFAASAVRAPVVNGSYSTFVFKTKKAVTVDMVNGFLEKKARKELKGILSIAYQPLVSSDIRGNSSSAILDASFTKVIDEDLLYLAAWYDNEWGYACRLVEMAIKIGR